MERVHESTTYILSPPVRELLSSNREQGHVHVMSAFRPGLGSSPREQLDLLWRVDTAPGLLTVQANEPPIWPGKLGDVVISETVKHPVGGDVVDIVVDRNCQRTPSFRMPEELREDRGHRGPDSGTAGKAYRLHPVIVPEQERLEWAAGRLVAIGLEPRSVRVGPLQFAGLGARRRGIPYVEIRARARVSDAARFSRVLDTGTGKGRDYGLGLVRVRPAFG